VLPGARRFAVAWTIVLLASLAAAPGSQARGTTPPAAIDPTLGRPPGVDPLAQDAEGSARNAGPEITPLVAPIPFKNTQLGWGLMLLVGAIHRFDADTTVKPSTGMVGGFYTENKSWGLVALEMARLQRDTWRLRGLFTHSDLRYDFYGIGEDAGEAGLSVGIDQNIDFAVGSGLYRLSPGLYAGAALQWMGNSLKLDRTPPAGLPTPPQDFAHATLLAPGPQLELDTRDDDYWPTRGSLAKLNAWFYSNQLGSARDFQRYFGGWSWYRSLRGPQWILATNVTSSAAPGDAPFYMMPTVGGGLYALRGYTQGRYRDHVMLTAQAETRWHADGRIGATTFFGFGQVASSYGNLGSARALPAGGLGLRYQITREYPMHMRVDYAWGRNGNLLYFGLSEAF